MCLRVLVTKTAYVGQGSTIDFLVNKPCFGRQLKYCTRWTMKVHSNNGNFKQKKHTDDKETHRRQRNTCSPLIVPSFLPFGSSNSIPIHSPVANCNNQKKNSGSLLRSCRGKVLPLFCRWTWFYRSCFALLRADWSEIVSSQNFQASKNSVAIQLYIARNLETHDEIYGNGTTRLREYETKLHESNLHAMQHMIWLRKEFYII